MVEVLGGKAHLAATELTGKFVPFRFWKEMGELRRARQETKQLRRGEARALFDKKKGSLEDYVKDNKDGLKHAVNAVGFLYVLIRNCAYDIHIIKGIIRRMHTEDIKLKKEGISPEIAHQLEKEVMQSLQEINKKLRDGSDMLGALTKE
jgi:hypothetical protein|tara:strand:- start:137 stop:583 length:447 start_codon:yes stop_codon:yes gene_type:complete